MTTAFAARKAVIATLRAEAELEGNPLEGVVIGRVDYGDGVESICLAPDVKGSGDTTVEATTTTPVQYIERYRLGLVVWIGSQSTVDENEDRADAVVTEVYRILRTSPHLGLAARGFISATIAEAAEIESGELPDYGPAARTTITLECKARLHG